MVVKKAVKRPGRKTWTARDLMSRPVRRLTTSATLKDAAVFMIRWKISGAPVVDEHGRWVGVFTMHDIARHLRDRLGSRAAARIERSLEAREPVPPGLEWQAFERTPIAAMMTPGMVTVFPDATVPEVVRSLNCLPIHRLFVVEAKTGELLGIITTRDVLRHLSR